ncbi:MAG: YtxH domain-containing protein [Pyrinomonadaceae bacterium]
MRYENENEESGAGTKLTYLLIGGGIGAILALLFAPKSGEELRGDIADVTRKGIEKGKETAAVVGERAGEYYEVSREKAGELYGTAQEKASELYSAAQDRVGDLKEKVGELTDKAGELTDKAKEAAAGNSNPFTAAIEAGKEAYVEEKQRLEDKPPVTVAPKIQSEDKILELPKDINKS